MAERCFCRNHEPITTQYCNNKTSNYCSKPIKQTQTSKYKDSTDSSRRSEIAPEPTTLYNVKCELAVRRSALERVREWLGHDGPLVHLLAGGAARGRGQQPGGGVPPGPTPDQYADPPCHPRTSPAGSRSPSRGVYACRARPSKILRCSRRHVRLAATTCGAGETSCDCLLPSRRRAPRRAQGPSVARPARMGRGKELLQEYKHGRCR